MCSVVTVRLHRRADVDERVFADAVRVTEEHAAAEIDPSPGHTEKTCTRTPETGEQVIEWVGERRRRLGPQGSNHP